jgi:hypothetical protein
VLNAFKRCRASIAATLAIAMLCASFGAQAMHRVHLRSEAGIAPCHEQDDQRTDECRQRCQSAATVDVGISYARENCTIREVFDLANATQVPAPRFFAVAMAIGDLSRSPPQRRPLDITHRLLI